MYDRETGRPKGFGFAEYPDSGRSHALFKDKQVLIPGPPDSAASAVRNLNDYEIMNRKLRVDFSNDGAEDETVRLYLNHTKPHTDYYLSLHPQATNIRLFR